MHASKFFVIVIGILLICSFAGCSTGPQPTDDYDPAILDSSPGMPLGTYAVDVTSSLRSWSNDSRRPVISLWG